MQNMIPISICMIAKNEEKYIDKCLHLLSPHSFEIVVADTGSTDRTVEIARRYTDKVFHFDWVNDFSAARNFSISKATHDWILVIDCDEFLEDIDREAIDRAIRQNPRGVGMLIRNNPYVTGGQPDGAASILTERVARLFSRHEYQYRGIIHEQATRIDGSEPAYFPIPLSCYHEGYVNQDTAGKKARRNLELLLLDLGKNGPDPYTYYQIGKSHVALKDTEKACHYFSLGLTFDVNPQLEYVQSMVESYGYCLLELKRYEEALNFENIYEEFATRADFPFLMGLIYMNNAMFDRAIAEFQKATTFRTYSVEGVNSYSAHYNIGVIYECTGHKEQAKTYYRMCGAYEPAVRRLEEL